MSKVENPNPAEAMLAGTDLSQVAGYAQAIQLATKSFDLMQTYRAPPIPKAYEIFYSYASGSPSELIERVDTAVAGSGTLDMHDLYQIHTDLFAYPATMQSAHEETSDELDAQLASVLKSVEAQIEANGSYTETLSSASTGLQSSTSAAALRKTIEALMLENKKARLEAEHLSMSLEISQQSISEMREKLAKAREAGLRDALTGLYNRRHFDQQLPRMINRAREESSSLCLCMADIDHFKSLNDTFGHPAGDAVLRVVGAMLAENVKGRDTAVRYGGEEFVIVLPETSIDGAVSLVDKIRSQLERKKLVLRDTNQSLGKITASFGVAELREGDTPETLVSRSDECLYAAKGAGRNRVEFAR